MSKKYKIEDFSPDDNNFNAHTPQGMGLLEKSIETVGIIESVTVSADDKVISGNARQEVIRQKFSDEDAIVIETDGTKPVIIKRTDIKSNTKQFFKAALLANTVSKHNVNLDLDKIQEVAVNEYGIEVEELGVEEERRRSIIGNNYDPEIDVNTKDYVIVYLEKRHVQKLEQLMDKYTEATKEDVIIKLIETAT